MTDSRDAESPATDGRGPPVYRVIDHYGIDITDRIIAEFGSVEYALEFATHVRALLTGGTDGDGPWSDM